MKDPFEMDPIIASAATAFVTAMAKDAWSGVKDLCQTFSGNEEEAAELESELVELQGTLSSARRAQSDVERLLSARVAGNPMMLDRIRGWVGSGDLQQNVRASDDVKLGVQQAGIQTNNF